MILMKPISRNKATNQEIEICRCWKTRLTRNHMTVCSMKIYDYDMWYLSFVYTSFSVHKHIHTVWLALIPTCCEDNPYT